MSKLLLLSVIVGMVVAPLLAARDEIPGRGLRKALAYTLVCEVAYLLALRFLYPRL